MVGRTDLLVATDAVDEPHKGKVDLSAILNNPYAKAGSEVTFDPKAEYNFQLEKTLDEKVLVKKCSRAIHGGEKTQIFGRSKEHRPCIWNNSRCGDYQK